MAHKVKYPFTRCPNWYLTTNKLNDKQKVLLGCYYRLSIGFNGCKYTHKTTFKAISKLIGMYERAVSKTSKELEKLGLIKIENIGMKIKVIHIKNLEGKGYIDRYLKKSSVQSSITNGQSSITNGHMDIANVQIQHNPPLDKEIVKDTFKETLNNERIKEFNSKWLFKDKVDIKKIEEELDKYSDKKQVIIIKTLPLAMETYKNKKSEHIPQAHNYIKYGKYVEFYEKLLELKKSEDRYDRQWKDLVNKRTPEQQKKIQEELNR